MIAGQVGELPAESVDGLLLAGIYLAVVDGDAVSQAEGAVRYVACGNGTVLRDRHLSPNGCLRRPHLVRAAAVAEPGQ